MAGIALATWGILALVDDHKYNLSQLLVFEANSTGRMSLFQLLSWSFITLGCATVLVGFCGCSALFKNNRWILGLYIFLVLAIFALDLATGLLAIIFQERLVTNVRLRLVNKLRLEYGVQASFTAAIDYVSVSFLVVNRQTSTQSTNLIAITPPDPNQVRVLRPRRPLRLRPVGVAPPEAGRLRGDRGPHLLPPAQHLRRPGPREPASSERKYVPIDGRPIPPELQVPAGEFELINFGDFASSCHKITQLTSFLFSIDAQGCLDDLEKLIRHKIWTFTIGCAAVGIVILVSLVFATCFCRSIPSKSRKNSRSSADQDDEERRQQVAVLNFPDQTTTKKQHHVYSR